MKIAGLLLGALLLVAALLLLAAGQLGFLAGQPPKDLGVRDGRLKPPSPTPNSVSSQAGSHADHPQRSGADIAPLHYTGDAKAALGRLATLLESTPGCVLVTREPAYLYAQCHTRWLKFTDDVEFALDEAAHVIQVRSASRLGRKDFGVNRARVEALRARFEKT
ncbi:DUF1499 domain-containing protein [Polaromonas sp.]|uniref:DUF1499 domain-containing protein n=1 Tax=Polaromonas sp. TaxID=1869339 RepID=UPI002489BEDC|nr:DUF1499 domain-containing protein [Polaromonas sp.]MDI1273873.1 DUF1499 domain-containing protein [Polaromonas sp.]